MHIASCVGVCVLCFVYVVGLLSFVVRCSFVVLFLLLCVVSVLLMCT